MAVMAERRSTSRNQDGGSRGCHKRRLKGLGFGVYGAFYTYGLGMQVRCQALNGLIQTQWELKNTKHLSIDMIQTLQKTEGSLHVPEDHLKTLT